MKKNKLTKAVLALLAAAVIMTFGTLGVFAEPDDDQPGAGDIPTQEVYTDPVVEPETEYEPPTEPQTEYIEPETEPAETQTEYVEPETQAEQTTGEQQETAEQQTSTQENIGYIGTAAPDETEFVPPTVAKTVSEKTYSTNYTAGIISWVCVIVGAIVVAVVLISTKVGTRRTSVRR